MGFKPCLISGVLCILLPTSLRAQQPSSATEEFKPTMKISGYTQFRATFGGGERDEFRFPRARVTLSGDLAPRVSYKLMVDIAAQDGKPLRDGYVEVALPSGHLRLGQFKAPMTLDYLTSSTQLDEINRARVVDVLAPQRDLGLQYSGTFPQGEYQVAVINGEGVNARDANDQKDVVGRVVVHPSEGTHLGVSYLTGRKGADSVHRQRIGLEARYTRPHLDAWAEYLAGQDGKVDENGWFLLVARPVRPGQSLRPFIRYEQFEPNDTVTGDREDLLTLGVTWFYTANTKVLLNYERRDWQAGSVDNVVLLQGQIIY